MATISLGDLTVPTANATDILTKVTDSFRYTGVDNNGVAETRANFLKRYLREFIRQRFVDESVRVASASASATADSDAKGISFT